MVVFNLIENERNRCILSSKRKNNRISRETLNLNNNALILINVSKDRVMNNNILKLLKMYKGRVAETSFPEINDYFGEYLYNYKNYIKKAIISNLIKNFLNLNDRKTKYIIEDDGFCITDEYFKLASSVRALGFVCDSSPLFQRFCDECYDNYGIVITKESKSSYNNCFYLNLNNIISSNKAIFYYKSKSGIIYADTEYFKHNNDVEKLLSFGVPVECACSIVYDYFM